MKQKVIDTLLKNEGKLPEGMSWRELGESCNILPADEEKAKHDERYKNESVRIKTKHIWTQFLKDKEKLRLTKEIYENGKLKWETRKRISEEDNKDFSEGMQLEAMTTNPYGGSWKKYRLLEKLYDEEHLEKLRDILVKEIEPKAKKPTKRTNKKGLFIHGSDKHIGALTKENSLYTNLYDKDEMRSRLVDMVIKDIEDQIDIFGTFDSLFIMDYGDALDGFNQKTTGGLRGTSSHTLPQKYNNREQHDFYVEFHRELFDRIYAGDYAEDVYFLATSNSNHGGDFEYGAMRNLQTYLEIKYPHFKTVVSFTPFNHIVYGKHCIIFGHGKDDEDMKHGLPLNLTDKVEIFLSDYIRNNDLGKYFISVISGDLHQSSENYGKNFRYKKVLSQYGSSKWMHTNFGSGASGLSLEIFFRDSPKIMKSDTFYENKESSNTGITFD